MCIRDSPGVLDKVKVDYYGAPTPVNQLAAVSVTEARTLTVQPWDMSVLRQISGCSSPMMRGLAYFS